MYFGYSTDVKKTPAKQEEGRSWNKHSCVPKCKKHQSMWTLSSAKLMYIEKKKKKVAQILQFTKAGPGEQLGHCPAASSSLGGMWERMGTAKDWDKRTVSEAKEGSGN